LGIATGKGEKANVRDIGISGITEADGLACASPSGFVTRIMTNIVAGEFTVSDGKLYDYLRLLYSSEDIKIEPSSCAAFIGPLNIMKLDAGKEYLKKHGLTPEKLANATQVCWATGGRLVPDEIWDKYMNTFME
jgi:D-serine dehydratase